MKKRLNSCIKYVILALCILQASMFYAGAQSLNNLVPNPSFEIYDSCPNSMYGINNATGWFNICGEVGHYFNSCATGTLWGVPQNNWGYQNPVCGNAYAQIAAHITVITWREYIGCRLIQPLKSGHDYCISFNVSLAEKSSAACDHLGLLLSDSAVICPDTTLLSPVLSNYKPQLVSPKGFIISDTISWTTISSNYLAHGGEQYLTLGIFVINDSINWTFRHPYWSHWCAYFVDNVSVYECSNAPQPANAGNDTIICIGDSLQLGTTNYLDYLYLWTSKGIPEDTTARPWVHPLKKTIYYLLQTDFKCQTTLDSITIRVKDCEAKASAGPDVEICQGDSIQLSINMNPLNKYYWISHKTDTLKTPQPWVKPLESTYFKLIQVDKYDTISSDSILISIKECIKPLVIPNVFTPNADGRNDRFEINNPGNYLFVIIIFNRWGNQIYKGDETHPWDGKQNNNDLPEGVYYYMITAITPRGQELRYQGVVHLLK